MAFPTILVNSATGSDTCGNATLKGTNAATSGAGAIVTLDGSPDLSGVATDGTAWIQLIDTAAGARNFARITATDNGAKTVTVFDVFTSGLTGKTWAINQTLASVFHTNSKKLYDNNSAVGDMMPGWTLKMQSGHAETITGRMQFFRAGDTTNGPITFCGEEGAATPPILTWNTNDWAIYIRASSSRLRFWDFEMRNSNGTKNASIGFVGDAANRPGIHIRGVRIDNSANKFWKGITCQDPFWIIEGCTIGNTADIGIAISGGGYQDRYLINNTIHNCASHGVTIGSAEVRTTMIGNLIYNNGGDGVLDSGMPGELRFWHNTCDDNAGDGLEIASASLTAMIGMIVNNIFSNNTQYGLNISNAAQTDAAMAAVAHMFRCNNFYGNGSGAHFPTTFPQMEDSSSGNPTYTSAATLNHSIGTPIKGTGYPAGAGKTVGTYSLTNSYPDPGAAQRQETGGGAGGVMFNPGLTGGMQRT